MRNILNVLACGLVGCGILCAQFQTGSLAGSVRDPSQSPIPGATIEIRSDSTNVTRTTVTSSIGEYDFVSLPPDQYTIKVIHTGFRETVRQIQVSVGQRIQADITLEIGGVAESVSVSGAAPLVETASSELGNIRSERQVIDLPLN